MSQIKFAIIDDNILACMGLKNLLQRIMPIGEITVCESFYALEKYNPHDFLHFFVSSRIFFEHSQWFREFAHKCIVLVDGNLSINNVYTLNVNQSESALIRSLMAVQSQGHAHHRASMPEATRKTELLSPRETEVAILLCKGLINKEIADRLNIALATVISHRKSIMEKLRANSLVDIIIYCVMNGIVSVEHL